MEALLEPLRELAEIEEIQNEKKKEAGLIMNQYNKKQTTV